MAVQYPFDGRQKIWLSCSKTREKTIKLTPKIPLLVFEENGGKGLLPSHDSKT